VVNPRSAGIDIGSRFHVVAVPAELDDNPVRKFSSFTNDLKSMAEWLLATDIMTAAMESTGIYWIPLCEIRVGQDIKGILVNARHSKNVHGCKTDISDAQ
jgi:transposase